MQTKLIGLTRETSILIDKALHGAGIGKLLGGDFLGNSIAKHTRTLIQAIENRNIPRNDMDRIIDIFLADSTRSGYLKTIIFEKILSKYDLSAKTLLKIIAFSLALQKINPRSAGVDPNLLGQKVSAGLIDGTIRPQELINLRRLYSENIMAALVLDKPLLACLKQPATTINTKLYLLLEPGLKTLTDEFSIQFPALNLAATLHSIRKSAYVDIADDLLLTILKEYKNYCIFGLDGILAKIKNNRFSKYSELEQAINSFTDAELREHELLILLIITASKGSISNMPFEHFFHRRNAAALGCLP